MCPTSYLIAFICSVPAMALVNPVYTYSVVIVQLLYHVSLWPHFITISWSLLKLMCLESVMPSNHLVFCCPFLLLFSIFPSIRVFSNELALHIRWPKYWNFSYSISPSNEYSRVPLGLTGLISLQSRGLSRDFSNTRVWKHKFFSVQPSL